MAAPGSRRIRNKAAGIAAKPPQGKKKGGGKNKKNKAQSLPGLTDQQNALVNQTQQQDFNLGGYAGGLLPQVEQSYSQPFDYSQLPQTPWSQGQSLENMNQEYYDKALSNYDRSMQAQFKQEDTDFEQQMGNQGIPQGSELYNKLKSERQKSRDSSRQNAMDSAYFNAGQNASNWNNIGTQNFQNAYGFAQDQRNQSLADYTRLMAAQSGMNMQNLGYSQAYGLQKDEQGFQKYMMKNTPRGGGGGGGGGAGPYWQQMGFKNPMEYEAWKTTKAREDMMFNWQNNPQYQQGSSGPSYASQLGGGILGSLASGWAMSGFPSPF